MAKLPTHLHQQIVHRICRAPLGLPSERQTWLGVLTDRPSYIRIDWTGALEDFANGVTHRLPVPDLIDALRALNRYFGDGDAQAEITALCTQAAQYPPNPGVGPNAIYDGYRQERIAEWSKPEHAIDKRFVRLILLKEQTEGIRFVEPPEARSYNDLRDVLRDTPDAAFVLLGGPGSGKSTLLRRLQIDEAEDRQADHSPSLTFFVPLNRYPPEAHDPRTWLLAEWQTAYHDMPPLSQLLGSGQMVLLLDALNEISHRNDEDYAERVRQWDDFLYAATQQGNRAVLTCRTLDYTALLGRNHPVTRVTVKPMTPALIETFLQQHLAEHAGPIYKQLSRDSKQLALYSTPYFLSLLVKHIRQTPAGAELPRGRAALFSAFIREALRREVHKPMLTQTLLTPRDRAKLANNAWASDTDLPDQGELMRQLGRLAYTMQGRSSSAGAQVRIKLAAALKLLPAELAEGIVTIGRGLNVLDEDLARGEVQFFHQLWQEYFAARQLAHSASDAAERVRQPWQADAVAEPLAQTLARLSDRDPLPGLPSTGWEETVQIAAAMTDDDTDPDTDAFVRGLMDANLPLAGLCAAAPDVHVSKALKSELQQALIARTRDPHADLRARIAAGEALGRLGDPRFVRALGPANADGVRPAYLRPPLIDVPNGRYTIGDNQSSYDDEKPAHPVDVASFALGQFPVTNAEFKCFIDAGGYDDERWWETDAAKAWRRGEGSVEGQKQRGRDNRATFKGWTEDFIQGQVTQNRITSKQAEDWITIRNWTDERFEEWLEDNFPAGTRYRQPDQWDDPNFNNMAQPVVGVSGYEAWAYCVWLSAQTGWTFRLPTEAEWEAACRGVEGRRYAYGDDFEVTLGNTFESHIRRTTPVGVFPSGATPSGLIDMTGNTWDWTSSLFVDYPYSNSSEHEDADSSTARVLRGGSWFNFRDFARGSSRSSYDPVARGYFIGFRVVCVRPLIL